MSLQIAMKTKIPPVLQPMLHKQLSNACRKKQINVSLMLPIMQTLQISNAQTRAKKCILGTA